MKLLLSLMAVTERQATVLGCILERRENPSPMSGAANGSDTDAESEATEGRHRTAELVSEMRCAINGKSTVPR